MTASEYGVVDGGAASQYGADLCGSTGNTRRRQILTAALPRFRMTKRRSYPTLARNSTFFVMIVILVDGSFGRGYGSV